MFFSSEPPWRHNSFKSSGPNPKRPGTNWGTGDWDRPGKASRGVNRKLRRDSSNLLMWSRQPGKKLSAQRQRDGLIFVESLPHQFQLNRFVIG